MSHSGSRLAPSAFHRKLLCRLRKVGVESNISGVKIALCVMANVDARDKQFAMMFSSPAICLIVQLNSEM